MEHTLVVFPCYEIQITGIFSVRIGARYVWITLSDGEIRRVKRSLFTPDELTSDRLAFIAMSKI